MRLYRYPFLPFTIIVVVLVLFARCAADKRDTIFQKLDRSDTGVDFINEVNESEALNILNYMYLYNGGGVALGDFDNDNLLDIFFTSNQHFDKLFLNKGKMEFEDISSNAGVQGEEGTHKWKTGVTLVDINHDGWLDVYVCEIDSVAGFRGKNRLYVNNKDLTFSEKASEFGLDFSSLSQQAVFFDYDRDGDLDMYLVNQSVHSVASYKGIENRIKRAGKAGDKLLMNDHDKFVDVSESAGIYGSALGYGLSVGIGDLNNDQWPDIYVSNDFHENDYLYYNNKDGTFTENVIGSMGHVSTFSMGNDIADIDNDGWLDVLTLDMRPPGEPERKASTGPDNYQVYNYKLNFGFHYQYPRNMLQFNEGHLFGEKNEVQFSELGEISGVSSTDWSWGPLVADFDNDGLKDILVTNGIPRRPNDLDFIRFNEFASTSDSLSKMDLLRKMPTGIVPNTAFKNVGGREFLDVSSKWGFDSKSFSQGAASGDLDNDGDLDIVISNYNDYCEILRNSTSAEVGRSYLSVHLVGSQFNPQGIGVRVSVYAAGRTQVVEKYSTRGWLSSSSTDLFFGLGSKINIDSVIVNWGFKVQVIRSVQPDKTLTARYEDAKAPASLTSSPGLVENISEASGITFRHHENNFIDFSMERLIPKLLSREGPKVAVGDVNKDGLDDFYIGGARGQVGQLYLQEKSGIGKFERNLQPAFDNHIMSEDVGSVFADIDLDGDLDLYVVSGGGEPEKGNAVLDRLYVNNGRGKFGYDNKRLPQKMVNGSCVIAGDFNGDGAIDFFIGGRSVPTEYGMPGVSALYLNDRTGKFYDNSDYLGSGGRIGMVTDAAWLSEEKKLVVVGEWMPVTIYDFNEMPVRKSTVLESHGLWNCIHTDDLNNDGRVDLLLGNMGLNSILSASPKEPLEMYVSDLDGNSSYDPLITYYNQNTKWLFAGLDELTTQVPTIRRRYVSHTTFSKDEFLKIFPANVIESAKHNIVETLESAVMINSDSGFKISPLPREFQVSPIFAFESGYFDDDDLKDILAVGNFESNQPAIGKHDASYGQLAIGSSDNSFTPIRPMKSGFTIYGDSRDVALLKSKAGGSLILVSRNSAAPRLFKLLKDRDRTK